MEPHVITYAITACDERSPCVRAMQWVGAHTWHVMTLAGVFNDKKSKGRCLSAIARSSTLLTYLQGTAPERGMCRLLRSCCSARRVG
jgi:hypothetical protein